MIGQIERKSKIVYLNLPFHFIKKEIKKAILIEGFTEEMAFWVNNLHVYQNRRTPLLITIAIDLTRNYYNLTDGKIKEEITPLKLIEKYENWINSLYNYIYGNNLEDWAVKQLTKEHKNIDLKSGAEDSALWEIDV